MDEAGELAYQHFWIALACTLTQKLDRDRYALSLVEVLNR